jgi:hypothetical protein
MTMLCILEVVFTALREEIQIDRRLFEENRQEIFRTFAGLASLG